MQKPQHRVAVSRPATEAAGGITVVYRNKLFGQEVVNFNDTSPKISPHCHVRRVPAAQILREGGG